MTKVSAGILLYRHDNSGIEFLLVHPGGPFWARKDAQAWSIPKGETGAMERAGEIGEAGKITKAAQALKTESLEAAARREFREETGMAFEGTLTPMACVKTSGNKVIHAFLGEGDFDPAALQSNSFDMEWPPKSGKMQTFPEVDHAAWFSPDVAKKKIHKGQLPLIAFAEELLLPFLPLA